MILFILGISIMLNIFLILIGIIIYKFYTNKKKSISIIDEEFAKNFWGNL